MVVAPDAPGLIPHLPALPRIGIILRVAIYIIFHKNAASRAYAHCALQNFINNNTEEVVLKYGQREMNRDGTHNYAD